MALAAHSTVIKASGTAVPITAEATTSLGGNVYQITTASRRVIDPSVAVVVNDGGVPIAATGYTFDYLFGKASLTAPPGGAVTVNASYLPMYAVTEVSAFSCAWSLDLPDITSFDSGGARKRLGALKDGSGSVTMFASPLVDVDTGAGGTQSLHSWLAAGTPRLIESLFGSTYYFRAWILFESLEAGAAVADLAQFTMAYQFAAQASGAAAGFGT
jgi:hypothetical protein